MDKALGSVPSPRKWISELVEAGDPQLLLCRKLRQEVAGATGLRWVPDPVSKKERTILELTITVSQVDNSIVGVLSHDTEPSRPRIQSCHDLPH